ncbi:MAG: hypothetical protein DME69_03255 [Verrucomicrobia bacterium]|nr:MAG: hypothetical protein DME69_03255 [Verrucomicrobiota bacterium]
MRSGSGFRRRAETIFLLNLLHSSYQRVPTKVRDREDALAGTRDARATRSLANSHWAFKLQINRDAATAKLLRAHH